MRSAVSLYEFMPYGAPELLESRRRHMSRALVATSLAALALYALTRAVAALVPDLPAPPPKRAIVFEHEQIEIQRAVDVTPPAPAPRPRAFTHPAAPPVVVPDELAKPSEDPGPPTPTNAEIGTGTSIAPTETGTSTADTDERPPLERYVYVEQVPTPITEVKPVYPRIAWEAGVEGRVTVHVLVGKDGHVLDAVLSKIQVPMLNEAALDAARKWRFTPGMANGHPVACWTAIPFNFRLH